ncbi:hypothetical protein IAQ61_000111 [Plenodomus lingam]|nr:hypothetical protein IAQ61_000111 [Plenodomus lingam]
MTTETIQTTSIAEVPLDQSFGAHTLLFHSDCCPVCAQASKSRPRRDVGSCFLDHNTVILPTPYTTFRRMCSYTYSWYYCNHDYYIWANSMEVCSSRLLSGYSYDAWSIDMCRNMTVSCGGFSNYYCTDCSEDVCLEYQLDEL